MPFRFQSIRSALSCWFAFLGSWPSPLGASRPLALARQQAARQLELAEYEIADCWEAYGEAKAVFAAEEAVLALAHSDARRPHPAALAARVQFLRDAAAAWAQAGDTTTGTRLNRAVDNQARRFGAGSLLQKCH